MEEGQSLIIFKTPSLERGFNWYVVPTERLSQVYTCWGAALKRSFVRFPQTELLNG